MKTPLSNPADPAYRPPLAADAPFLLEGPVDHPNLKELMYQSMGADQVVADIGCGPGPFEYERFAARFIAFDAFEPEDRAGLKSGDRFVQGRLESFPLEDGSCDAAAMGYILEHVPNPGQFIAEADRVLKPGGYCYIAVPHYRSLEDRLFRLATRVAGSTRGPHIQRFTFENFQGLVGESSSLELVAWHNLGGSFLWMMHPKLRLLRPVVIVGLKLLRAVGVDFLKDSNFQFLFRKAA